MLQCYRRGTTDHQAIEVHEIADHRHPVGAAGGSEDGGALPQPRDKQRDFLRLESQVRRYVGVGREAAEGTRGRERLAEAAAGEIAARPGGAEGSPVAKCMVPLTFQGPSIVTLGVA